jgi:hypothetical protein
MYFCHHKSSSAKVPAQDVKKIRNVLVPIMYVTSP